MIHDGHFRIALLGAWLDKCAWCRRSITVSELEVDHILPESLTGDALVEALRLHGQPESYDLQEAYNLVPACGRCNRFKGNEVPPADAPIIAIFLRTARKRAPQITASTEKLKRKRSVDRALAVLNAHLGMDLTESELARLTAASRAAQPDIVDATGTEVALHPALALIANSGTWEPVSDARNGLLIVKRGTQVGYSSANPTHACCNCGSHGPWTGYRCLTCGFLDDSY
jgi:hypothetical protein